MQARTPRTLIILTAFALVLATAATPVGALSGQVYGSPEIEVTTSTVEVSPGTHATLDLAVTNRGEVDQGAPPELSAYESKVTTARGLTLDVKSGSAPIEVKTGTIALGDVPKASAAGAQSTVSVPPIRIDVAEDAAPGTYRVPIEYSYRYTRLIDYDTFGAEYADREVTETAYVTIRVPDEAQFAVVETNATAQIGDTTDVSLTLRNRGTRTAGDASVTATSRSAAATFDAKAASSTAYVGAWAPGETRTVNYSVGMAEDATLREYTLGLSVDYTNTDGLAAESDSMTAGLSTIAEQTFDFSGIDTTLRVGEEGTVAGTVTNTGPTAAENVVIRYAEQSQTILPVEESVAVGSLTPGETAPFAIPVEVTTEGEAGTKSLSFAVRYRNQDGDLRTYDKLDVMATVAPERDAFAVEIENGTVAGGSTRTLSVAVTNQLDETVTDVESKLYTDDPIATGDADTGYVGSIEPGETVTMTFELSASSSATTQKTYPISFDFRYDDADGDSKLSETMRVPIEVVDGGDGGLPLIPIGAGLVLLVGAVLAVLLYRRQ